MALIAFEEINNSANVETALVIKVATSDLTHALVALPHNALYALLH